MKLLKKFNPEKVSLAVQETYYRRRAVRAVIFDGAGKIALLEVTKENYHKLPGGGVEKNETDLEALQRECFEEAGCRIKIVKEVGRIIEIRRKFNLKQESLCYLAQVIGVKTKPRFTAKERHDGFIIQWLEPGLGVKALKNDKTTDYHGQNARRRDLLFLETALRLMKKQGID